MAETTNPLTALLMDVFSARRTYVTSLMTCADTYDEAGGDTGVREVVNTVVDNPRLAIVGDNGQIAYLEEVHMVEFVNCSGVRKDIWVRDVIDFVRFTRSS